MVSIVLGTFYGDEGKGQTVHNLCARSITNGRAPLVVRFSGGHQVGHTVRYGNLEHTFSNFGSGTLLGVPTYWSEYCTVDPLTATREAQDLVMMGCKPSIMYSPRCQVVIPFDVYSQINNEENLRHGTVGTGFKACLDRVKAGYNLMVVDCLNLNILREKINAIADNYYKMSSNYPSIDLDNWCRNVYAYFQTVGVVDERLLRMDADYVFEGSQGILLDQRFGIMPYCTPSNTTSQNAYELLKRLNLHTKVEVCYVTRPYITRHGNGPFCSTKPVREVIDPNNKYNDFQKTLRAIDFDVDLFNHSLMIDGYYSSRIPKCTRKVYVSQWDLATDDEKKLLLKLPLRVQPMIYDKLV